MKRNVILQIVLEIEANSITHAENISRALLQEAFPHYKIVDTSIDATEFEDIE